MKTELKLHVNIFDQLEMRYFQAKFIWPVILTGHQAAVISYPTSQCGYAWFFVIHESVMCELNK